MQTKFYFDTNVIVDFFDRKRPFYEDSIKVFKKLSKNEKTEFYINSDTLTNLFYILRHHIKLDLQTTIEKLELIKGSFFIVSIDILDIETALDSCKNKLFDDYEDALQYVCALKVEADLILSNNKKDFKNSTIEVATTKELSMLWRHS